MKKFTSLLFTLICLYVCVNVIHAQNDYFNCGSTQQQNKLFNADPQLKQQFLERESELALQDVKDYASGYLENKGKQQLPIYIIPVVVHVIHQGGTENISDAQIMDAIRILNEDYRKLNSTAANTVSQFQSIAADCEIEFRLAKKDPNGLCTNGIDRILSDATNNADDGSKLNPWPNDSYLNIWSVKTIGTAGVAGYAYFPGTSSPDVDGILILSNYIGSIGTGVPSRSHALTHEVGHYISLYHTWGSNNDPGIDCSSTDNVSDTPPTEGWTSCNLSGATCGSTLDNVQNYMEYSYCPTMFTTGQKTKMRNALTSSIGQRNNLWTSSNLSATGVSLSDVLCKADFESDNSLNTVCQGSSLTFTDLSWNGLPTSWNWVFQGGTPATSTDSAPVITYNTPGIYTVSLTVSNSSGSANVSRTAYVTVNPSSAVYNNTFYSEGFEGASIPTTDWKVHNTLPGGNTWVTTAAAAATGGKSVMITNTGASNTNVDDLIGPSIDMTAIAGNSPTLTFKVAHAQKTSTSTDKLQVYISTNCGLSWVLRKSISGASLSTAGVQSTAFTPTVNQWVQQSVNLTGYASQSNLYYMFRFTSGGGNHIYLDDININGTPTGIEDEVSNTIDFNVYPNPAEKNTIIYFSTINKQKVELEIFDIIGRPVSSFVNGVLNAGEHQYSISENADLSAGVYFISLSVDKQRFTKKLIIK